MKDSALSLISRECTFLTIWNPRFKLWLLPGGLREESDLTIFDAQRRELKEETGLETLEAISLHSAAFEDPNRGSHVHIFGVFAEGKMPVERWMRHGEFIWQLKENHEGLYKFYRTAFFKLYGETW